MTTVVDGAAHLALTELESDISQSLQAQESFKLANAKLMELQPEVTWEMRFQLIEFMAQAQAALDLVPTTLALAVSILDRYMSVRVVHARHFQLLGCVCLWLAAKTIDDKNNIPTTGTLAFLCARTYEESMFREMEFHVLCTLDWDVLAPVANDFIDFSVAEVARALDGEVCPAQVAQNNAETLRNAPSSSSGSFGVREFKIVRAMSQYVCECAMFSKDFVGTKPSTLAASAVAFSTTALEILQMRGWSTVYPKNSSKECFEALVSLMSRAPMESAARYAGEEQFSASQLFHSFFETYSKPAQGEAYFDYSVPSASSGFTNLDTSTQPLTPEHSFYMGDARAVANSGMPLTPENEAILNSGKPMPKNSLSTTTTL